MGFVGDYVLLAETNGLVMLYLYGDEFQMPGYGLSDWLPVTT